MVSKYDVDRIQDLFWKRKRAGFTLQQLADDSGVSITTAHRVVNDGRGRDESVDAVLKTLGFKNGRKDVVLSNGRRRA